MARFVRFFPYEAHECAGRDVPMDVLYLGLTVGFFALSWAFIVACERLS